IPDSVTSIGKYAFYGCEGLKSVRIPAGVTSISDYTFYGCEGLKSLTFPAEVTSIGKHAFYGCAASMERINVDPGNTVYHSAGDCLIETSSKKLILGSKNSVIPNDGSVTSIGDYAYFHSVGLTSITIPDSVTSIGYYAFEGSESLSSVAIPNSVTTIGYRAFYDCPGLTSIAIPESVTNIADYALGYETTAAGDYIPVTGFTIYGDTDSAAQDYARNNGFAFVAFSDCKHENTVIKGFKAATCGEDGYTGDRYCKGCGVKVSDGTVVPKSHTWNAGTVTTPATCAAGGVKTFTCTVCGDTKTEAIVKDANNHTGGTEIRNAVAASDGSDGYTGDTYCKGCGVKLASGTVIPAPTTTPATSDPTTTPSTTATPATEPTTAAPSTTTPETTAPTITAPASTTTPTTEPTTTVPTTTSPATTASTSADTPTIPDKLFDFGGDDTGVTSEETADTFKYASKAALTKSELVAAITAANDGAVVTVKDKDGNDIPDDAAPGTGSTVTVSVGGATATKTLIVLGDVDGDGNINASDARLALRAAAKLDTLEGPFASAADADGDGSINAIDARGILRAAAKLDVLNVA
ncbi:MAG: leucine-rich repeat protein, partial [Clostridia bacterium]|nr:leucine-rich repeat protein [Clostridia bacterium]